MLKVNNKDTIFADVTKIVAMFIKAIFKTKKVCWFPMKNPDVSRCLVIHTFF